MEITPENVGAYFRFPAEWEPHEAIWLLWPRGDEVRGVSLFKTMRRFAVTLIEHHIRVHLCVHDDAQRLDAIQLIEAKLKQKHGENAQTLLNLLTTHEVPHGTYWARDFGPIFMIPRAQSEQNGAKHVVAPSATPIVLSFPWTCWGYKWNMKNQHFDDEIQQDGAVAAISARALNFHLLEVPTLSTEGGDREFNGLDSLIVCRTVEMQRNPGKSQSEIQTQLEQIFGCRNIIWMNEGLADDRQIFRGVLHSKKHGMVFPAPGTGGHVDEFVRFVDEYKVLLAEVPAVGEEREDPIGKASHEALEHNLKILQDVTMENGRKLEIIRLPLPPPMIHEISPEDDIYDWYKNYYNYENTPEGRQAAAAVATNAPIKIVLAASYCNFLVTNGLVIAAKYHSRKDPTRASEVFAHADARARLVLEAVFPDRKVVQLDCYAFNLAGGGFHCTSQQQPKY